MLTSEETLQWTILSFRELLPSLKRYTDQQIVKKVGEAKLSEAVDVIADFILDGCKGDSFTRAEYTALATQLLSCLRTYLEAIEVPVTVSNLVKCIHHLPKAVDRAFPSYAAAGLLRRVVSPRAVPVERVVLTKTLETGL